MLDIKQYLAGPALPDGDPVPPEIIAGMKTELAKSRCLPTRRLLESLEKVVIVSDLDRWLDELYDAADYHRVWLGT